MHKPLLQSLKLAKENVQEWLWVGPDISPSVGRMSEPGLESTVCNLLGPFMSSEQDYLVCICNTEGSNKGSREADFLEISFTRKHLRNDPTVWQAGEMERPRGGESGHQALASSIPPTYSCVPGPSTEPLCLSIPLKWWTQIRYTSTSRFLLAWKFYCFSSLWNPFVNSEKILMWNLA